LVYSEEQAPVTTKTLSELYASLLKPQTPLSPIGTFSPSQGRTALSALLAKPSTPLQPANTLSALRMFSPPQPTNVLSALAMSSAPVRLGDLLSGLGSPNYLPLQWIAVTRRFTQFHQALLLTPAQRTDGMTKRAGVVSCLNSAYYDSNSQTDNSFFVGSWGKDTAIRPPRDVDIYFLLPPAVYNRFQGYIWNPQSALLQEVKDRLIAIYPATDMSGDGQVVVVNFGSYCVEVVPAFMLTTQGRYWICNTHDGGSYKETAPWAEVNQLDAADTTNGRNLRPLIRMLKAWQARCSVPIKSFHLELLATEFIGQSPWRLKDFFYFDWITRDFFEFLCRRVNGYIIVPGTYEVIALGDAWQSRALSAHQRAVKACDYERDNLVEAAGDEWQKIFGLDVPRTV
jgi:Second Messenger Oligonucleotide or Dinucleotide Synthetase domain